jgi:type IV pilus assembly protein PilA
MVCGRCGSLNTDGARFCGKCGSPLQAAAPSTTPSAAGGTIPVDAAVANAHGQPEEMSGKAVASLTCGFLFFFFPAAIAAIILGHLSLGDIRKSAGRLKGHGVAVGGLVLGYLGVVMIPVILIVAAIAIPNLLRSRMAANEASAVASLRTINRAAITYSQTYGNGYPANLEVLTGSDTPSCDHAGLIDGELASGTRNGYLFSYQPTSGPLPQSVASSSVATGCTVPGAAGFAVTADPIARGVTGQRSFFVDQTGVIRVSNGEWATVDSPPLQ